ncbi:MAG TPA: hypothetical protein VMU81_19165 [Acetobacteraceae bacterium]|nr:hypothetical protein [Acetobacteraceae bacterium]
MLRSRIAHGTLRGVDADAARSMPGVHLVVTAAELDEAGIRNMPAAGGKNFDGTPTPRLPQLARDRPGPPCRRTDRDGGGRDAETGQGRGRVDLRRYRLAAGGDHCQCRLGAERTVAA